MKFTVICLGLALSMAALADGVSLNGSGTSAILTGSNRGITAEIVNIVAEAHEIGFKDVDGADFFVKTQKRTGTRNLVMFKNKYLNASLDSAFAVIYKVELKSKVGEMTLAPDLKTLTIKGEAARLLLGSLATVNSMDNTRNRPLGISRHASKSGKVVCSKVVAPRAVPTCTLKL